MIFGLGLAAFAFVWPPPLDFVDHDVALAKSLLVAFDIFSGCVPKVMDEDGNEIPDGLDMDRDGSADETCEDAEYDRICRIHPLKKGVRSPSRSHSMVGGTLALLDQPPR